MSRGLARVFQAFSRFLVESVAIALLRLQVRSTKGGTGIHAFACARCRVRQSRPHRRRGSGRPRIRDRTAGDFMAYQQVPQSDSRWRGLADTSLEGYKINNPTLLARISHEELDNSYGDMAGRLTFVEGSDPETMHQAMAVTKDKRRGRSVLKTPFKTETNDHPLLSMARLIIHKLPARRHRF